MDLSTSSHPFLSQLLSIYIKTLKIQMKNPKKYDKRVKMRAFMTRKCLTQSPKLVEPILWFLRQKNFNDFHQTWWHLRRRWTGKRNFPNGYRFFHSHILKWYNLSNEDMIYPRHHISSFIWIPRILVVVRWPTEIHVSWVFFSWFRLWCQASDNKWKWRNSI